MSKREAEPEEEALTRSARPRRQARCHFEIGARVGAKFTHDGKLMWFFGTIAKRDAGGWVVDFDDGNKEIMPEHVLKFEEQVQQELLHLEQWGAAQAAAVAEICAAAAAAAESTSAAKEEEEAPSMPPPPALPIPPPSNPKVHIKVEHEDHSCGVKDEHEEEAKGGAKRIKDAYTLSREALRRKLQFEPDGKTPRAVFRAGCHPRCLTQVLGGVGTDMERFATEDKVLPDGHALIKKGEMYLWGRADWNTYAPSFAGDIGAYRDDLAETLEEQRIVMGWEKPQTVFHLFRQCTERFLIDVPYSGYHGKDAEKKTLYCGRYRADDGCTYQLAFKELPPCTQECICELAARREVGSRDIDATRRKRRAEEIMSERERENHVYTIYGVEYVDYDEKLYQALVDFGADNGRVDIDDAKLGPL